MEQQELDPIEEMRRCVVHLPYLSYFEWFDMNRYIYVSFHKKEKKGTAEPRFMPKNGDAVFELSPKPGRNIFLQSTIRALMENEFGFFDFFWFLKKKKSYTFEEIVCWMRSLIFCIDDDGIITLKSTSDPDFALTVYVYSESLPLHTTMVLPVFIGFNDGKNYVVLEDKPISDFVHITFSETNLIFVLSESKFGKSLLCEQLTEEEAQRVGDFRKIFQANKGRLTEVFKRSVSKKVADGFEKNGFPLSFHECNFNYLYTYMGSPFATDCYDGYRSKKNGDFGYKQSFLCDVLVTFLHGAVPEKICVDPRYETKPVVMEVNNVFDLVKREKIKFAYESQLQLLSIADFSLSSRTYEQICSEVGVKYESAVRVVMVDGKFVCHDYTFNKMRLNISIDSSLGMFRVVGFF